MKGVMGVIKPMRATVFYTSAEGSRRPCTCGLNLIDPAQDLSLTSK